MWILYILIAYTAWPQSPTWVKEIPELKTKGMHLIQTTAI